MNAGPEVTLLRSGGNHTVTYRTTWPDGCESVARTNRTYIEAKSLWRNDRIAKCSDHRATR